MVTIDAVTAFFGWCSVINLGLLVFTTLVLSVSGNWTAGIHARLFGLNPAELPRMYFQYLANYKIAILVFNLVPYIALKLMM
jgi:uncharacterized membrane protein